MPTLALNLSAPVAARWQSLTEDEQERRAAIITDTLAALDALTPQEAEEVAAIQEAIAEAEAGLDMPFEEYAAQRNAHWQKKVTVLG